ncbi:hypothetical protein GW17_00058840, partial [Ensete ventricosum]
ICHAFKDYFFVRKLLLCCFIISAYTILVLQDMRSVIPILQLGAAPISADEPTLSVDQLADQVAEVLDYFG